MLMRICSCGRKLRQGEVCTCRHKIYDKSQRNQKKNKFYRSSEWLKVRQMAITRANGLDEYSFKYEQRIIKGNLIHHIFELDERPDLNLSMDNLICVSNRIHNMIHAEYDKSKEAKIEMQNKLMAIREAS